MKWPDLPKKVAISGAVLGGSLVLFLVLYLTLGSARDGAVIENEQLKAEVARLRTALNQSQADYEFVVNGKERYEALIAGTKLVPHARRAAVRQLQSLASTFGLSTLNYNFKASNTLAPNVVANQPASTAFRVNVEDVELTVGAPIDGNIYKFVDGLALDFPGSIVVQEISLDRASQVTTESLNAVAAGRESGLVKGKIGVSWRTAQRNADVAQAAGGK